MPGIFFTWKKPAPHPLSRQGMSSAKLLPVHNKPSFLLLGSSGECRYCNLLMVSTTLAGVESLKSGPDFLPTHFSSMLPVLCIPALFSGQNFPWFSVLSHLRSPSMLRRTPEQAYISLHLLQTLGRGIPSHFYTESNSDFTFIGVTVLNRSTE